jgi:ABC-type sugar transport system, periplasmic component
MSYLRYLLLLCYFLAVPLNAHPITQGFTTHLLFISPAYADDPFWLRVEEHMGYAATSLGFDLKVKYGNDSPLRVRELAIKAMQDSHKPDFLILQFNGPLMPELLQQGQKKLVQIVTINAPASDKDRARIGSPGSPYINWIAHLWPDDKQAGFLEAKLLLDKAKERWPKQQLPALLAFNGTRYEITHVAEDRGTGLQQALEAYPGSRLAQEFSHYWNVEKATQPLLNALARHPEVRLLWCASDNMALRLYQRLEESGKNPHDFLLAGIDATPEGLTAVEEGKLVGSVGGHFLEGAWAEVVIHDYLYSRDNKPHPLQLQTRMYAFRAQDIALLRKFYQQGSFARIDYHQFTIEAQQARGVEGYDFSWPNLVSVAEAQEEKEKNK